MARHYDRYGVGDRVLVNSALTFANVMEVVSDDHYRVRFPDGYILNRTGHGLVGKPGDKSPAQDVNGRMWRRCPEVGGFPNTPGSKWFVRKKDDTWYIWRPCEVDPIICFESYPSLWQPDCQRFLRGVCCCRTECPY